MITDALASAGLSALSALLSLFPNTGAWTLGTGVSTSVTGWVGAANSFFPVTTAVTVLGFLVALQFALMLWDLGVWIFHQFWGSD